MKLASAASRFDRSLCHDAYNLSAPPFKAQLDLFDDNKRDGMVGSRRVLSTAPAVVLPARHTIVMDNQVWLAGSGNSDQFNGSAIRKKHTIQKCEGTAFVRNFAQTLAEAGGMEPYTARGLIGTSNDFGSASYMTNRYEFFFTQTETVRQKDVILHKGVRYIVRSVADVPTEFRKASVDEIKGPSLQAGTHSTQVHEPLSDTFTGVDTMCNVLCIQWQSEFTYLTNASPDYLAGDMHGVILKSAVPATAAGDTLLLSNGPWAIRSVVDEGACWGLLLRRD